jgi:hypothetical protein
MRIVFVAAAALLAATTFASAAPAVSSHAVKADSTYQLVKATKKVAAKKPAKKHAAKKHVASKGHHKTCGTGKYFSKKAKKCVSA